MKTHRPGRRATPRRALAGPLAIVLSLAMGLAPAALLGAGPQSGPTDGAARGESLFAEHCATCHGADRLGGVGPALLPAFDSCLRRFG